jgi:hypothetical protein
MKAIAIISSLSLAAMMVIHLQDVKRYTTLLESKRDCEMEALKVAAEAREMRDLSLEMSQTVHATERTIFCTGFQRGCIWNKSENETYSEAEERNFQEVKTNLKLIKARREAREKTQNH